MFKRILIPLDGSEPSESILAWVVPLAEKLNAELILTTVVEVEPVPSAVFSRGGLGPPPEPPEVMAERESRRDLSDRLVTTATGYLEAATRRHIPASIKVRHHVVSGKPEDQIVTQAVETGADLIAMATHRASPIARGVLGSVADRVLHSSSVPVLMLRPNIRKIGKPGPRLITDVIVPLDVSPASENALDIGMKLADSMDARLRLMTTTIGLFLQGPAIGSPYGRFYTGGQLRAEAREYLQPFVEEALDDGIEAEAIASSGDPARAIISAAHEKPGAMVVMVSHGLSGFHRWVLGSVTDKVVRGAECPVLVVPLTEPGVN